MNLKSVWLFLAVLLLAFVCSSPAQAKQKTENSGNRKSASVQTAKDEETQNATHTVIVYYLYMEPRCTSCRNIEAFTKEAIEKKFEAELKSGRLVWKPVDVKKEGNWHYVEDFQLRSKSVVVADYEGLKEDKEKMLAWKNLEEVWSLLRDKPKFLEYIQTETRIFLDQKYVKPKKDEKKNKDKSGSKSK